MCPHTAVCVLILLCMCPYTATYLSAGMMTYTSSAASTAAVVGGGIAAAGHMPCVLSLRCLMS